MCKFVPQSLLTHAKYLSTTYRTVLLPRLLQESRNTWNWAFAFVSVPLVHAESECWTRCSLVTHSASATELWSFFFFPWKSTPQHVLPQSVCAGLQYNFTRVDGPYASFQQEGDVVFGLEPHWLSFHSQHFVYASAVRSYKRQPPWLVSAVGGACAQPSVICQRTCTWPVSMTIAHRLSKL